MTNRGISHIEVKPSDWVAGDIPFVNVGANWADFLPDPEKQVYPKFDAQDCVSRAFTNAVEIRCNQLWASGAWTPSQRARLIELKVVENGKFNFSDRALAKMAGTTRKGVELQKVFDAARTYGLVGESVWAYKDGMDWDEYYETLPLEIYIQATEIKELISIEYEWIILNGNEDRNKVIRENLKHSLIQVATPLCRWFDAIVIACGETRPVHSYVIYGIDDCYRALDSYPSFLKKLDLNFFIPWASKIVVNPVPYVAFKKDLAFGATGPDVKKLQKVLNADPETAIAPGPGGPGQETFFYGLKTADAVYRFQRKYGLIGPFGLWWYQGTRSVVGPKTRAKLNQLMVE